MGPPALGVKRITSSEFQLPPRPAVASALSAGLTALLAASLPYQLGLIVAAVVGIVVGTYLEGRQSEREVS